VQNDQDHIERIAVACFFSVLAILWLAYEGAHSARSGDTLIRLLGRRRVDAILGP
jgi:hypothetical protein